MSSKIAENPQAREEAATTSRDGHAAEAASAAVAPTPKAPAQAAVETDFLPVLPRVAAIAAILCGLLVLIGWATRTEILTSVVPGLVSMKPNEGIGFILAGLSLLILARPEWKARKERAAQVLALLAVWMGFVTLFEYFFDVDLRLNSWLPGVAGPLRMAPLSAFTMVLIGSSLILLDWITPKGYRPAQFLAVSAATLAFEVLLNYAYGSPFLYFGEYTRVALHSAALFLALSLGVFFLYPEEGLAGEVTTRSLGGLVLRRVLLAAVCLLPLLGCLRLLAEKASLIDSTHATTLMVLASLVMFVVLVWRTATALNEVEQKRTVAEEALRLRNQELTDFFENASVGISWIGADGVIQWANRTELEMLGYRRDEYVGHHVSEFHCDAAASQDLVERWRRGEELRNHEMTLRSKDGSVRTVAINCNPYGKNGQFIHTRCFNRDVSQRKVAEEALRRLNTELDQRVRLRTAQLEATNKELEAFCYSVSHDLRAPLRNIVGFSQALLQDYNDKLDHQGKEYLERACAAGGRMSRLIEDLLNLSRVGRSELTRHKVDLSVIVQMVANELATTEPSRRVTWKIQPNVTADADPRQLGIAFQNLLGNAWKFTSKKEDAQIEFGQQTTGDQKVLFVRDNGAGFDMSFADKLFGVFQRLHSAAEFPGTGIGLATVQRIINRHGGRIWAEAEIGKGAAFYFTLPTEPAITAESGGRPAQPEQPQR